MLCIFFLKPAAGHLQITVELMVGDSLKLIMAIIRNIQEENHRKNGPWKDIFYCRILKMKQKFAAALLI